MNTHSETMSVPPLPVSPSHDKLQASLAHKQRPRAAFEIELAAVWEQTLSIRPIGLDDDFFALGGDWIHAQTLARHVLAVFGHQLPTAALTETPTLRQYAQRLARNIFASNPTSFVQVQAGGEHRPLVCVHAGDGGLLWLPALAKHLPPDQPVYGLQSPALFGDLAPLRSIRQLASYFVHQLLTTRPDGNCALLGYCMGGIIALEMARQLRQQGHRVGPVVLIETPLLCKRSTWRSRCAERWRNTGVSVRWLAQRILLQWQTHRRREQRLYGHDHRVLIRKRHRGLLLRYPPPIGVQDVICLLAEQTRRRHGVAECEQLIHTLQPTPQRIIVPGDHRSCVRGTHLPHLAKILHETLESHP